MCNKKYQALIISSWVYSTPPKDGDAVAKIVYDLSKKISKDELNIHYTIFDIQDEYNNKSYEEIYPNLDIKRIKIPIYIKWNFKHIYFHFMALFFWILNWYRLVVSNNQWGVFLSKLFFRKTIFISHSPFWWIKYQKWEVLASKISNKPIAISNHIFSEMKKYNNSTSLIYNGVDIEKYKLINVSRKKSFLYVWKICERKNIFFLIKAFEILQKKYWINDYVLDIVWPFQEDFWSNENKYYLDVKKYIDDNKIMNINFHWPKWENELIDFYNKSSFFILPSLSEWMPLVLLESMSCWCIAISNDFKWLKNYFPKESWLYVYDYNKIDSLIEVILDLIKLDENQLLKLRNNIIKYIENNYSYEIIAKKYNYEIKKLLWI